MIVTLAMDDGDDDYSGACDVSGDGDVVSRDASSRATIDGCAHGLRCHQGLHIIRVLNLPSASL